MDLFAQLEILHQGGQALSANEARAWVFQMIGAIQYLAISSPAISGMYGKGAARAVLARFDAIVTKAVKGFAARS